MHIILENGLNAAKKNMGPGLLLQGFALAMVLLYYFHAPSQAVLLKIPKIQQTMGFFFPIVVTTFFGGLIPFFFMLARKDIPREHIRSDLIFMFAFWAFNGLTVDYFYKAQALMFGTSPDVITVVKKVCFDQFVFSVFWSTPYTVLVLYWKRCGYSFRKAKQQFSRTLLTLSMPSLLISLWGVWLPTVAIVYSLPLALQFPLFNIVLCFWSLMLASLSHHDKAGK